MLKYKGETEKGYSENSKVGILLVNLGSPDDTTEEGLRRYLKEFLWDPRVVEVSRLIWWFALNFFILRVRPKKSAETYKQIWTDQGSPLTAITRSQSNKFSRLMNDKYGDKVIVDFAMRYGNPSISDVLNRFRQQKVRKLLIVPMYPQYCAATSASVMDAVFDELKTWRVMPELRSVMQYHHMPEYINALADSIKEKWEQKGRADRLLFSFHGIPKRYVDAGDPYYDECQLTAAAVARKMGLEGNWYVTFQSRFGREEYLTPYTDKTLIEWGKNGVKSVEVICPGFSADCLETLEEIEVENREYFLENGGEKFEYIQSLNDRDDHIMMLKQLTRQNLSGWIDD
ncbi:MAG: ferrochelatase [Gammaproteobacteria bacterium]|nr:ferrochelatase [Gammaproteobacteria bacterium]